MEEPALARPVLVARRRSVVLPCAVACLAGAGRVIQAPTATPIVVERVVVPPPVVVAAEPPLLVPQPLPDVARPSCPPARTDAGFVRPPKLPVAITQLYAAPTNAGWLVAYNADRAFLSTDAGATFERVLDGKGKIRDVGIDCFGRLAVVRTGGVGVREGSREHWRALPGLALDGTLAVLGGGPDLVVVGLAAKIDARARLASSSDLGATWTYRDFDDYFEGADAMGRQWPDGSIDVGLVITDCSYDALSWRRIANGKVAKVDVRTPNGHQIYGETLIGFGEWKRRSDPEWRPLEGEPADVAAATEALAIPAPYPVVVDEHAAYRIQHGKVRKLPLAIAGSSFVMDAAGRLWSLRCGQLHVAGRSTPSQSESPTCLEE